MFSSNNSVFNSECYLRNKRCKNVKSALLRGECAGRKRFILRKSKSSVLLERWNPWKKLIFFSATPFYDHFRDSEKKKTRLFRTVFSNKKSNSNTKRLPIPFAAHPFPASFAGRDHLLSFCLFVCKIFSLLLLVASF